MGNTFEKGKGTRGQMLNPAAIDFDPRAEELALWGIIYSDSYSTCSSRAAFSSLRRLTIWRKTYLSVLSSSSSCFTSSSSSRVLFRFVEDFIRFEALPFSTNWCSLDIEWLTWEVHAALKGLSEFGAHLNHQVALLLESGLPLFGGIFYHLFELGPVNSIEDVWEPLSVHVIPVPLVRQMLHGVLWLLSQLEHVLNS